MLAAVAGQVAVVAIDHRDARADEARDREHRNTGAERKGRVSVAQVVKAANRLDVRGYLRWSPVAAAEDAEVDPAATRVSQVAATGEPKRLELSAAADLPAADALRALDSSPAGLSSAVAACCVVPSASVGS
jgi:hypothetical protein